VTWVRSFRTCERIEHKHEHEHEHEHEIRVGAQYVSHAARAKLPETNMNMNTNTRKRTGPTSKGAENASHDKVLMATRRACHHSWIAPLNHAHSCKRATNAITGGGESPRRSHHES